MADRKVENHTSAVSSEASRRREAWSRWDWTERSVWTPRMLETLMDGGPKGGHWYSLYDKVAKPANLRAAWEQVRRNGGAHGVDRVTVEMFEARLDQNLERMHQELTQKRYSPRPIRRVLIPKPGRPGETRPLGIPTVWDRVVQTAARNVLEPIFEAGFAEHSYGFRPRRGCKDALRRVQELVRAGYLHVVDADLKGYFDSIPHDRLMSVIETRISDGAVLGMLRSWLEQPIMEGVATWTPEGGTPQGAVISPLLANAYLDPLDHLVAKAGIQMVRYADDFVLLCRTRTEADAALALVAAWTAEAGLTLHPEKTRVADLDAGEGFTFLGYTFKKNGRWPSNKTMKRLRERLRPLLPRKGGQSVDRTIATVNRVLRGWFEYFKHTRTWVFDAPDGWVRMRLRAMLWRHKRRTRFSRRVANLIWPNDHFARLGLFSLAEAHREAVRQPRLPLQPALR